MMRSGSGTALPHLVRFLLMALLIWRGSIRRGWRARQRCRGGLDVASVPLLISPGFIAREWQPRRRRRTCFDFFSLATFRRAVAQVLRISAISGHSFDSLLTTLEVYMPWAGGPPE